MLKKIYFIFLLQPIPYVFVSNALKCCVVCLSNYLAFLPGKNRFLVIIRVSYNWIIEKHKHKILKYAKKKVNHKSQQYQPVFGNTVWFTDHRFANIWRYRELFQKAGDWGCITVRAGGFKNHREENIGNLEKKLIQESLLLNRVLFTYS